MYTTIENNQHALENDLQALITPREPEVQEGFEDPDENGPDLNAIPDFPA